MADIDDQTVRVWVKQEFRPLMEQVTQALATMDFVRDGWSSTISQRPAFVAAAGADTIDEQRGNDGVPQLTKAEIETAMGHIQSLATLLTTAQVRDMTKGRVRPLKAL